MPIDQAPSNSETDVPEPDTLSFDGGRGRLFRLLLVNAFLTLVTLGIYRFWAKTNVRRFFWGHTQFLDDSLEYTGTGGELFLGFLIVIAVLFPVGFIYGIIGAVVPPDADVVRIALEIIYYLVLFALLQIGFYRMWRYRMSRTTWRGVRFGLDGSSWAYLRLVTLWTVLTAATLGVAYPWMKIDLWRYQARHTRLGRDTFRFEGDAKSLLVPWLFVILPMIIVLACWGLFFLSLEGELSRALVHADEEQKHLISIMAIGSFVTAFTASLAYAYFKVCQTRLQISGLRLGAAEFQSELPFLRLLGYGVLSFVTFIVIVGAPLTFIFNPDLGAQTVHQAMIYIVVLVALLLLVAWPIIWITLFGFELAKQLVQTTVITNPTVLERASQSQADTPGTGEGLADALDIGGF